MLNHVQTPLLMLFCLVLSATFLDAEPSQADPDQITLRGTIEAVDHDRTRPRVTLSTPGALPGTTDRSPLADFTVGDRVQTTPGAAEDDFVDRLTFSVLWGVDNQFSGNMIQAATGQTTTGVPITMNETTYDDVYGRMGAFKLGVGYRISPRSEAVLNFAYANSGAQTVTVGTAGTANVPLTVDFDDYSYWGFEGGQRFFFSRVRLTPYVGYLIGLNRYGDIRGTFVDVPLESTPGLAAQDGKFFENSWAFSFGPTGGLLIGVGPIELMLETQLRYMGKMSDVDWLVEEGLRDINDESSRWSLPIQLGARIRF